MAGLSDVNAGMNLDPQTLAKILAMRKGRGVASGGGQLWYDPSLKTDDPNGYILHNYAGQGPDTARGYSAESGVTAADPSQDQNFITKLRPDTGGKLGDQWDLDGNYKGTVQLNDGGGRDFNQGALMFAGAVGGNLAMANGAGAGAGGLSAADGAALDSAMIDMGAGATNVADAGLMEAMGGTTAVGGATTPATTTAATTAAETAATKLATDAGTKAATDAGLKLLTTGAAAVIGGDALSDPVDTSRYDKLFENMLSEQALASQRGKDLWADYTSIWRPAQIKFADAAMNFDTPARREQAAQAASAGLASTYDQQRQTAYRDMMASGLDPSTIQALGASSRIVQAKDDANVQNTARNDVEKTGLNLLKGVVDQGNTIQNQATQQSNVATNTTGAASNLLTQQGNVQNQNTQNRNAVIGDLFTGLSSLYGMSQTKTGT